MSSANYHAEELRKHCRVCGKRFPRKTTQLDKNNTTTKELIETCNSINFDEESDDIHPLEVCYACVCKMRCIKKAQGSAFLRTDLSLHGRHIQQIRAAYVSTSKPHTEGGVAKSKRTGVDLAVNPPLTPLMSCVKWLKKLLQVVSAHHA